MSSQLQESGVNRPTQRASASTPGIDYEKKYYAGSLDSNLEGFIHHPSDFPLQWRKLRRKKQMYTVPSTGEGHIGLCFLSEKYIKPGTYLELSVNLRGETQSFTGQVILVRSRVNQFEIGVWFSSREDAGRIRIVEQICHIESYLKLKRHHEGPFFNQERVAQEWVARFASQFPTFSQAQRP